VHKAMEARAPGSTRRIADEHVHHEEDIRVIEAACRALLDTLPAGRAAPAARLYRLFDLFLQENLAHMRYEEEHHNAVLWASYTDEEIHGIERALVAALPPEKMTLLLHSMVPSVPTRERAMLLGGLRAAAPPEVFAGVYASLTPLLDERARGRLHEALSSAPLEAVA